MTRVASVLAALGAAFAVPGLLMVPLPGPGWPVVALGVPLLAAGAVLIAVQRQSSK